MSPAGGDLERHYRRLLLAYPRDYREHRAEEMLTTLLDGASPGQRRPTRGEAAHLVLGGLRQRLRMPGQPAVWVAAVLSALIFAAVAATIGAGVGWLPAGDLPDNRTADDVVTAAFAPLPGIDTTRYDGVFGYDAPTAPANPLARFVMAMGDDTYTAGYVRVVGQVDERPGFESAATALRRSGWRVDPPREDGTLNASKAGLALEARVRSTDGRLVVTIRRAVPRTVVPLTVAGWFAGAIAGWLFAAALTRRAARQSPGVQLLMLFAVGCGLVLLTPATAVITVALVHAVIGPGSTWASPPWAAYTYPVLRPLALLGMLFTVSAGGLSTLAAPAPATGAPAAGEPATAAHAAAGEPATAAAGEPATNQFRTS